MIKYNPAIHHRRSIRLKGYDYSQRGYYFVTICSQNKMGLFGKIENDEIQLNDAGRMISYWYSELENKFRQIRCDSIICMPNHIHFIVYNVGADLCVRPGATPNDGHDNNRNIRPNVTPNVRRGDDSTVRHDIDSTVRHDEFGGGKGQTRRSAPTNSNVRCDDVNVHRGIDSNVGHDGFGGGKGQTRRSAPTTTIGAVVQWFKTMTTNAYIHGVKKHGWAPFPGKLWQRNYWEHIVRNNDELQKIRNYIINNPKNWFNDKLNGGVGNSVMESLETYNHQIWMI